MLPISTRQNRLSRLQALEDENTKLKRLLAEGGVRDERAAGVQHDRGRPQDDPLSVPAAGRRRPAGSPVGAGGRAASLRLPRRQEGLVRNRKRTQRLYHQEGLTVRRRRGRKRATGAALHAPVSLASPPRGWRRIGTIGPAVAVRFLRQHGICVAGPDDRGAIEKGLTTIINR